VIWCTVSTRSRQLHDGANDLCVAISDSQGLSLAYYDTTRLPMYPIARQYSVAERFHAAAFGGSYLNHQWLVTAQTPVWTSTNVTRGVAPNTFRKTSYDPTQTCLEGPPGCATPIVKDGQFVTDAAGSTYFMVSTVQPSNSPHPGGNAGQYGQPGAVRGRSGGARRARLW
jgi:acid phosphatase